MLFLRRGVCSVPTQGRAFLQRHFCITHSQSRLELPAVPSLANARSYGLARCPVWTLGLLDGLLVHIMVLPALPLSCSPPGALLQMAMTKDVFGGSRVIHGQNCPISDEISQKLDLYSDRPKRGRVYAGRASQSSTHGGRPRLFPASNTSRSSKCKRVRTHAHSRADTPS